MFHFLLRTYSATCKHCPMKQIVWWSVGDCRAHQRIFQSRSIYEERPPFHWQDVPTLNPLSAKVDGCLQNIERWEKREREESTLTIHAVRRMYQPKERSCAHLGRCDRGWKEKRSTAIQTVAHDRDPRQVPLAGGFENREDLCQDGTGVSREWQGQSFVMAQIY